MGGSSGDVEVVAARRKAAGEGDGNGVSVTTYDRESGRRRRRRGGDVSIQTKMMGCEGKGRCMKAIL